jgi:hypothetical protein
MRNAIYIDGKSLATKVDTSLGVPKLLEIFWVIVPRLDKTKTNKWEGVREDPLFEHYLIA